MRLDLTLAAIKAFTDGEAFALAEEWLTKRAEPLFVKLPEDVRKVNHIGYLNARGTLAVRQGRKLKENSPEREKFMNAAIQDYSDVLKEDPHDLVAGNNLAWLMVKEKNDPARALAVIEEVRKGKNSGQPITPERLSLELLDTMGVVYRANNMKTESLALFKEATRERYAHEPRLLFHLGMAQMMSPSSPAEAAGTLQKTINLAEERRKQTIDPQRKDQLAKVAAEALAAKKDIGLTGGK
jgi:hypothetical protein